MRADSIPVLNRCISSVLCMAALLAVACSLPTSTADGGGTRGGNPVITGRIVDTNGKAAGDVSVSLLTADYNPVTDAPPPSTAEATTDRKGIYSVTAPDSGHYTITAVRESDGNRLIRFDIMAFRDSTSTIPDDTLHRPGTLEISLPEEGFTTSGYVYIPGTRISARISGTGRKLTIDSVPAETLPVLYYSEDNGTVQKTLRFTIPVLPDETTLISNPQWQFSCRIILNTWPTGAEVTGDVYNFPVLIRLTNDNFNFSRACSDGRDLMITGNSNNPLPLEIERWNPNRKQAEVWVTVDTVHGNDSTQSITMYWGNEEASAQTQSAVFDTADGFTGVWHLGDAPDDSIRDATANNYNGISPDTARPEVAEGIIGNCRRFNGSDDVIIMSGTADSRLSFTENGNYTVSAWAFIDTFHGTPQLIVSKGYEQYFLRSTYFPSDFPSWEFVEFHENGTWHSSRSPATGGKWVLVTGVRQGETQQLYLDGVLVNSTADIWPNNALRNTSNDLSIGAFLQKVTIPDNDGYCFFRGMIDEVRITAVARNEDWIRLCYMNQREDDKLVLISNTGE